MVQLLVDRIKVDVNAHCVVSTGDRYANNDTIELVEGSTALHVLASADYHWQLDALRYLLDNGADVNTLNEKGQSALHIAAGGMGYSHETVEGFWRYSAIRILLDYGADPNIIDEKGFCPLHRASSAPNITRELLQRGADATIGAKSPIFLAIKDQSLPVLEILLDHGLCVDAIDNTIHSRNVNYSLTDSRKVYAVLCAAYTTMSNNQAKNSTSLLRALVERGAALYVSLNDDETLIHFLFEFPEYESLDTLLQEPCVSRIDFNRRDQRGRTVLMAACSWRDVLPGYSHRHWDTKVPGPPLRILEQKADATLVDNDGKTALHHLLNNPDMPDDVLLQFINRDEVAPTLFTKDNAGYSPFHYALQILRPEVCELLLSKGANILEPDPAGFTVLHHVATQWSTTSRWPSLPGRLLVDLPASYLDSSLALWQRFLATGGSINAADKSGNTPLHIFMLSVETRNTPEDTDVCHVDYFNKLFPSESGVDIFATNHERETALHVIARRMYHNPEHEKGLFKAMMDRGLDPLDEDLQGRTPLDIASACGQDAILEMFGR